MALARRIGGRLVRMASELTPQSVRESSPPDTAGDPGPAARPMLPATVLAVGLAGVAALVLRDPHRSGSWGSCPILTATGLPCPFCGGLRAVNDLAHGDLAAALSSNAVAVAFVVAAFAVTLAWLISDLRAARRARPSAAVALLDRAPWGLLLGGLFGLWLAFGLLRLVPPFTGLQP